MSNSRARGSSRRTIVVTAAVIAVTVVVALTGIRTMGGSRSFVRACQAIMDRGTPFRMIIGQKDDGREHCIVVLQPVLADPGSADAAFRPRLSNDDEVFDSLMRSFPGEGGETDAEGFAVAHFLVDETGVVQEQRIAETSGSRALDEALLAIGSLARFAPVETEDGPTEAWVALTVGFGMKQDALQQLRETLERWRREAEI